MIKPRKQQPPASLSQSEQQQGLEESLKQYSCVFDEKLSSRLRNIGLQKHENVCGLTRRVMTDYADKEEVASR